jgi:hypothetical protein
MMELPLLNPSPEKFPTTGTSRTSTTGNAFKKKKKGFRGCHVLAKGHVISQGGLS